MKLTFVKCLFMTSPGSGAVTASPHVILTVGAVGRCKSPCSGEDTKIQRLNDPSKVNGLVSSRAESLMCKDIQVNSGMIEVKG